MRAKVSILVPIYNVEDYVDKCLTSLEKQSFKDIEIWAVSDGSPDNSAD
ncbi:glycosyltransferase family 2 protein, partial [Lactobacillus crispatus]